MSITQQMTQGIRGGKMTRKHFVEKRVIQAFASDSHSWRGSIGSGAEMIKDAIADRKGNVREKITLCSCKERVLAPLLWAAEKVRGVGNGSPHAMPPSCGLSLVDGCRYTRTGNRPWPGQFHRDDKGMHCRNHNGVGP